MTGILRLEKRDRNSLRSGPEWDSDNTSREDRIIDGFQSI